MNAKEWALLFDDSTNIIVVGFCVMVFIWALMEWLSLRRWK